MNIFGHIDKFKTKRVMKRLCILTIMICLFNTILAQTNNNVNYNNNNNNIIINNQPVIEKVHYIEKYRTVYVDRPQPKRHARKLSSPVCLLSTIWVYTEDLGDFRSLSDANEIVNHLNARGACGRNDWRIPTSAELTVMEQNADKVGLGDGIYIATSHSNGILRPVSTGPSIAEKRQEADSRRRQQEAEETRIRTAKNAQNSLISTGHGMRDGNGLIWSTTNVGATTSSSNGSVLASYTGYNGWRLPTSRELSYFVDKSSVTKRPDSGYLKTFYTYNGITLVQGRYLTSDGYYDVGGSNGITGKQGYVRLVQDEL
ncbi:MAG: hypothetical protein IJQ14_05400 [Bacteroidales bacterium]|nr:hypothetical protein [Bacteroidales bacterium]